MCLRPIWRGLLGGAVLLLGGCFNGSPQESDSGQALYESHCAECHQSSGKGSFIQGIPAINQKAYPAKQLVQWVREGHGKMPALKDLNEAQTLKIATHLKQLSHQ